jgi:hypothetical protein
VSQRLGLRVRIEQDRLVDGERNMERIRPETGEALGVRDYRDTVFAQNPHGFVLL